jgi:hypothetical protein
VAGEFLKKVLTLNRGYVLIRASIEKGGKKTHLYKLYAVRVLRTVVRYLNG